ncbi:MAG: 4Fe-4S binding protein [bacterium]|nr:4Fe-4S binding protein [bacterium]
MKRNRRIVQFGFLALTLVGVFVARGNAERWCPFGGVEALYTYLTEGNMLCSLGVSNFYILGAVLLLTVLYRRAFCGYMCPIGTISEWLQAGAKRLGLKPARVPSRLDRVLSKAKYLVLGIILYFTWTYGELEFRVADPCYALLSRHGEDITFWAYVVSGAIVLGSLFVVLPFCRWLCPFAAVLQPFSKLGLTRVKRHKEACVDCGLCSEVCPTAIPVATVDQVTAARCLSCLNCVDVCPRDAEGAISWGPPRSSKRSWPQASVVVTILMLTAGAVAAVYVFPMPSFSKVAEGRGAAPAETAVLELGVHHLTCRGSASLFGYFVERDDEFEIPGYLKIEAWPGPGAAPARITYDPAQAEEETIREAITEPYYDSTGGLWRASPFKIEGYDLLDALETEDDGEPEAAEQTPQD